MERGSATSTTGAAPRSRGRRRRLTAGILALGVLVLVLAACELPKSIAVEGTTPTTVTITWVVPESLVGKQQQYGVFVDGQHRFDVPATAERATVGDLAPSTTYEISLELLLNNQWTTDGPSIVVETAPDRYVALGDSYTSGPLIPVQRDDPGGCLRSTRNYPSVLAPSVGADEFEDASCSGAETEDMTAAQGVSPGPNPPQFDRVNANTTVVTLGIGGNDMGFSELATGCATANPFASPCQDRYVVDGRDEISVRIADTGPKVAAVLDGIDARAPESDVFVVGYPAVVPDSGNGCWPTMPIGIPDVPYLRAKVKELNAMLAAEAAANGDTYVDVYTASIGHDPCASSANRWVEAVVPTSVAAPVHPNENGMRGIAAVVLAAMGGAGAVAA
jgi:hypothetical protein